MSDRKLQDQGEDAGFERGAAEDAAGVARTDTDEETSAPGRGPTGRPG